MGKTTRGPIVTTITTEQFVAWFYWFGMASAGIASLLLGFSMSGTWRVVFLSLGFINVAIHLFRLVQMLRRPKK